MTTFVSFNSGGNDSVAMLQWLIENGVHRRTRIVSLYTNTGWAADYWSERMERLAYWIRSNGILHAEVQSQGFESIVRDGGVRSGRKHFPTGVSKFCTRNLKFIPALNWLEENDEDKQFVCCVGKRRAESLQRSTAPAIIPISENHGGRLLLHPLVEHSDGERDKLVLRTPMELLDHRSDECTPCIFASRADLRRVTPDKVNIIRAMERDTGETMFRPIAYAGAKGIDEVMRWARAERGTYKPGESSEGEEVILDCESDFCGL